MLEATDLRSGYGRIPILSGITFSVAQGEVVGVLGHNGTGKTTLLRTLVGELRTTHGTLRFDGKDVTHMPMHRRVRAGLGYVPQGRDIFPQLTVMENLRMGEITREGESAIPELLELFPVLKELLDRPGRALSGGEQQILALARCLVGRPKLLLLDEPTEGVQPSIVEQIAEKLVQLTTMFDLTVLLVEQDLHFIAELANRVLIILRGRIVAEIEPGQLSEQAIVDEYLGI